MLQETSEATSILYKAGSAPIYDITDITIYLKLLESDGVLTAKALLDLANILKNANELKKYFHDVDTFYDLEDGQVTNVLLVLRKDNVVYNAEFATDILSLCM